MYMVLARLRLLPTGLDQIVQPNTLESNVEIDSPLTLSRGRGLGNASICNKTLEVKISGKKCCITAVNG